MAGGEGGRKEERRVRGKREVEQERIRDRR
jgi:hypothetical protein